ncbi:MAG: ornithine cyclodeaminase family protein [Chloroflexi bacterium]|nr:ornithine cyclodeaminase family protein [Chloroflexota bacterium]
MTLILNNEEIEKVLTMDTCLQVLEDMYRELGTDRAINIPRSDLIVPSDHPDRVHAFKTMSGGVPKIGVTALRLNSDIVNWPERQGTRRREKVPAAPGGKWLGLILLFSNQNGELLSIFPDGIVQRMRVGATNGLGAKYLARKDAATVGLLGSGWQAGTQLMAFCGVRQIRLIKVFSPNPDHRQAFAREMNETLGVPVRPVDSAEEAVKDVDILAAATNAIRPVIRPEWLAPGIHVSAIKRQEVDETIFQGCHPIFFHTTEYLGEANYALKEVEPRIPEIHGGWWQEPEKIMARWEIHDLKELVTGRLLGRTDDGQTTCFLNNIGMGVQFAAVGARVYQLAREKGLGREIDTDWFLQTVHP